MSGSSCDDRADEVLRRQSRLESERANWESHWAEAAERVLPRQRDFQGAKRAGGEKLSDKVFDSTAPLALEKFAAAMESMLTPRNERWHELTLGHATGDRAGEEWPQAVKEYLYAVTSVLFRLRYAPSANFASQAQENPVYVREDAQHPAQFVPVGFVRLHDAAAGGAALPDAAGVADDAASAVTLAAVAGTVIDNYGSCNATREQLIGLQGWVRAQQAAWDRR
ncbi:MAG: phage head-tail adapter protein [Caulobacter sp.]|nr:phage head-tail adapter protein [Caulobacter sp.]